MDWFEKLTGFVEGDYAETQSKLRVEATNSSPRSTEIVMVSGS